jgi:hypothetical protein
VYRPAECRVGTRARIRAAEEELVHGLRVAYPGGVLEERSGRRAAHDAAEVRADELDDELESAAQRAQDQDLLGVRAEPFRDGRLRVVTAGDAGEGKVAGVDLGRGAELGERPRGVVAAAQDRVLVRRPQGHVSAPGFAARPVEVAAVLGEQAQELGAAAATDGVREERSLGGIRGRFEQQPHVFRAIVVEGVGERVRAPRLGAVLEQEPEACRVLGLGRVVERLVVVRVRSRLEQDARQLRIVRDPAAP